jgi:lipopolysaccharide export system protein LptA
MKYGDVKTHFHWIMYLSRIIFLFLICGCIVTYAQESNIIVLEHADVFSGKQTQSGEDVREMEGSVRFHQGSVRVWCDKAIQYLAKNEVELNGNVKIVRDTITLTARKGRYFGNAKIAVCEGNVKLKSKSIVIYSEQGTYYADEKRAYFQKNVKVIDSSATIFSDQLTYYEKDRKSIAILNVRILNPSDNVTMFGNYLEHYDSTRYSKMSENPRLIQIDTSTDGKIDTMVVKSILMESYDDTSKKLIATDSVVIIRSELAARCELVRYFRGDDRIQLFTKPIIWYQENQVTGDSIELYLEKNRLKKAVIKNRAFVISESDSAFKTRFNQLSGRLITLHFKQNKLQEAFVERNATSVYFLYDDSTSNGVNKATGDFISMFFEDGKPKTISIVKGIEGNYYPENLVVKDESKYQLDGFLLRKDRPKLKTIFPSIERNGRTNSK